MPELVDAVGDSHRHSSSICASEIKVQTFYNATALFQTLRSSTSFAFGRLGWKEMWDTQKKRENYDTIDHNVAQQVKHKVLPTVS